MFDTSSPNRKKKKNFYTGHRCYHAVRAKYGSGDGANDISEKISSFLRGDSKKKKKSFF